MADKLEKKTTINRVAHALRHITIIKETTKQKKENNRKHGSSKSRKSKLKHMNAFFESGDSGKSGQR